MTTTDVDLRGAMEPGFDEVLTTDALAFVAELQRRFGPTREELLRPLPLGVRSPPPRNAQHAGRRQPTPQPWAGDIYQRARARGATHQHAARILGRAWCQIIWRVWQDHDTYDPHRHTALQRVIAAQG
jgi:hypothetical protein